MADPLSPAPQHTTVPGGSIGANYNQVRYSISGLSTTVLTSHGHRARSSRSALCDEVMFKDFSLTLDSLSVARLVTGSVSLEAARENPASTDTGTFHQVCTTRSRTPSPARTVASAMATSSRTRTPVSWSCTIEVEGGQDPLKRCLCRGRRDVRLPRVARLVP